MAYACYRVNSGRKSGVVQHISPSPTNQSSVHQIYYWVAESFDAGTIRCSHSSECATEMLTALVGAIFNIAHSCQARATVYISNSAAHCIRAMHQSMHYAMELSKPGFQKGEKNRNCLVTQHSSAIRFHTFSDCRRNIWWGLPIDGESSFRAGTSY